MSKSILSLITFFGLVQSQLIWSHAHVNQIIANIFHQWYQQSKWFKVFREEKVESWEKKSSRETKKLRVAKCRKNDGEKIIYICLRSYTKHVIKNFQRLNTQKESLNGSPDMSNYCFNIFYYLTANNIQAHMKWIYVCISVIRSLYQAEKPGATQHSA